MLAKKGNNSAGGGIGICGALFIVFLVLKLTGHITWSWLWVFCPLWAPAVVGVIILLIAFFIVLLIAVLK